MHQKPLVSVITIFYNAEEFLSEAVESVLNQSYENWELLLVDDGSTDHSTVIAVEYAERYSEKIRYFQHQDHQNFGKSSSRNLGIREAKGVYIVFLDADDILLPQKLEHQAAILDSHPEAGMVYGTTQYWFSWTKWKGNQRRDSLSKLGLPSNSLIKPPALTSHYLRDAGIVPCLCSLMTRTRVIDEVGGFDESIQHLYEDQVFLFKICLEYPVLVDERCGERYRQHPHSSSFLAIKNGEYHPLRPNPARVTFLSWLNRYISSQRIEDIQLHKALQRALWPYHNPYLYRLASPIIFSWLRIKFIGGLLKERMLQSHEIE
jgi:glycosyltransferase involved in cell wall biosynthesis